MRLAFPPPFRVLRLPALTLDTKIKKPPCRDRPPQLEPQSHEPSPPPPVSSAIASLSKPAAAASACLFECSAKMHADPQGASSAIALPIPSTPARSATPSCPAQPPCLQSNRL